MRTKSAITSNNILKTSEFFMLDSQLLHTLRLLEPEEIETLHLFVASPIFQDPYHGGDTLRLFEDLKKFYPAFDDQVLQREMVADRLFMGKTNPGFDVTRAMSDLMRITRNFINFRYSAVQSGRARHNTKGVAGKPTAKQLLNHARQQLALMRFYNERLHDRPTLPNVPTRKPNSVPGKKVRHANNFFENLYAGLLEEMEQVKDFSAFEEQEFNEYLYFRYLIQQEKSLFDGRLDPFESDQNLIAAIEELDAFYLFNKLRQLSRFISLEQQMDLSETQREAYQRIVQNKKFMLLVCRLISKTEQT